ncbi:MAG: outer membrane beta-barrel protein [Bacteroidetes bacterium]|nr:outer membrane beta-barrel protein [Bacteroidota bacterium]
MAIQPVSAFRYLILIKNHCHDALQFTMTQSARIVLRCTLLVGMLLCLFVTDGLAQYRRNHHGFRQTYPGAIAIGFSAGPNLNFGGSGPAVACDCEFDGGYGIGYHAGIHADIYVNRFIGLRLQGLYEDHSSTYVKSISINAYSENGAPAAVDAERRAEVDLQYISSSFMLLWFTGMEGLYFLAGASAGFFVDGNLSDEEFIVTPGYVYPGTGSNRQIFGNEALDAQQDPSLRAGLVVGAGYALVLSRGVALTPELQFDYPLTTVVEGNAEWSIPTLRATLGLTIGL